jgi:hypothetical protein
MGNRRIAYLSLATLILTAFWLVLLAVGMARSGPVAKFEQALTTVTQRAALFRLGYLNAAAIVVVATLLFAGLYCYCWKTTHLWSAAGMAFVPAYATLNLVVYLCQVTAVPQLVALRSDPAYQAAADVGLRLLLQAWPGSAMAFLNSLAYALLGIPSLLFGLLLRRTGGLLRWGGTLLALNGVACWIGAVGALAGSALLASSTTIGGILFLLALAPISVAFLRDNE